MCAAGGCKRARDEEREKSSDRLRKNAMSQRLFWEGVKEYASTFWRSFSQYAICLCQQNLYRVSLTIWLLLFFHTARIREMKYPKITTATIKKAINAQKTKWKKKRHQQLVYISAFQSSFQKFCLCSHRFGCNWTHIFSHFLWPLKLFKIRTYHLAK